MRSGESTERITTPLLWSQDQLAVPSARSFKVFKGQIWKRRLHSGLGHQKMQSRL